MTIKLSINQLLFIAYVLINLGLFFFDKLYWGMFFIPLIYLYIGIYHSINREEHEQIRRKKTLKLLSDKYPKGKIDTNNRFKTVYNTHNILIDYKYYNVTYSSINKNTLNIYLDISDLEDDLKSLCKIHFNCRKIEDKDYIYIPRVFAWKYSLKSLVKNSEKHMKHMVFKYEQYVNEKRKTFQTENAQD